MRLSGADRLELGLDGELIAHTDRGPVVYTAPIAYQDDEGGRRSGVTVHYALAGDKETYGFVLGDYDQSRPLVIDPLLQATYMGGTLGDVINAIAIHPVTGEVLVAGFTSSTNLLCTSDTGCPTGEQPVHAADGGSTDAFVARFSADLASLLQATYLGGNGSDLISGIAIHPVSGEVVVAGSTTSTNFPCTTVAAGCGAGAQPAHAGISGSVDGFVARLNANLTSLLQATYFGDVDDDFINAIAPLSPPPVVPRARNRRMPGSAEVSMASSPA